MKKKYFFHSTTTGHQANPTAPFVTMASAMKLAWPSLTMESASGTMKFVAPGKIKTGLTG